MVVTLFIGCSVDVSRFVFICVLLLWTKPHRAAC